MINWPRYQTSSVRFTNTQSLFNVHCNYEVDLDFLSQRSVTGLWLTLNGWGWHCWLGQVRKRLTIPFPQARRGRTRDNESFRLVGTADRDKGVADGEKWTICHTLWVWGRFKWEYMISELHRLAAHNALTRMHPQTIKPIATWTTCLWWNYGTTCLSSRRCRFLVTTFSKDDGPFSIK